MIGVPVTGGSQIIEMGGIFEKIEEKRKGKRKEKKKGKKGRRLLMGTDSVRVVNKALLLKC